MFNAKFIDLNTNGHHRVVQDGLPVDEWVEPRLHAKRWERRERWNRVDSWDQRAEHHGLGRGYGLREEADDAVKPQNEATDEE